MPRPLARPPPPIPRRQQKTSRFKSLPVLFANGDWRLCFGWGVGHMLSYGAPQVDDDHPMFGRLFQISSKDGAAAAALSDRLSTWTPTHDNLAGPRGRLIASMRPPLPVGACGKSLRRGCITMLRSLGIDKAMVTSLSGHALEHRQGDGDLAVGPRAGGRNRRR
jgi:hypothetical protein